MEHSPLLGPVVALVAWTVIMMFWLYVARARAFKKAGITLANAPAGGRGVDLDGRVDPQDQWKAHNYNHLMEQPTIFYAIVFALILMGFDHPINVWLAWGYVLFRVLHSLVQATVNVIRYRFACFLLSSICLVALTVHAALRLLHG